MLAPPAYQLPAFEGRRHRGGRSRGAKDGRRATMISPRVKLPRIQNRSSSFD